MEGVELVKEHVYKIGGVNFKFKKLSLDESSEAGDMLTGATAYGSMINLRMSNDQMKLFLSKVLVNEKGESYEPEYYGKIQEETAAKILSDFFLGRFNSSIESNKQLATSMAELME